LDRITLPKLFKQAGYHTAVIGKWHLGLGKRGVKTDWNGAVAPGPLEVGFDDAFLLPYTNDRVPCVYLKNHHVVNLDPSDPLYIGSYKSVQKSGSTLYPDGRKNPEAMTFYKSTHAHNNSVINGIGRIGYQSGGKSALWDDSTMTQVFVDHVREYIARHRKEPFFLFYTPQNIHVPRVPAPRFRGKTTLGYRGDSMVELDWAVGEVLRAVEENGLTENTLIIFSSDNGPTFNDGYDDGTTVLCSNEDVDHGHDASGLWRGGKYQILEGGTRVPFIVSWPNHVKAGQSDALVSQVDLLASFAAMLHISLPKESAGDSRNMLDTFLGQSAQGLPFMIEESRKLALRQGKWKYVQPAHPGWPPHRPPVERGLYNLQNDPLETNNLISAYPEKAQAMEAFLCALEKAPSIREQKGAAPASKQ
jgi:arylsulfatase A-like enzyme